MKEMIYTSNRTNEVLESGTNKGFNYKIVSYGTHPCCYVEIPSTHRLYKKDYNSKECLEIDCHGGLTFADIRDFGDGQKYYIGWDYAHFEDYSGIYEHEIMKEFDHSQDKKWTTEELIKECKEVIEQL